MSTDADVIIVGGGVAGLAAALTVARAGRTPLVLEGQDRIGGRIQTDEREGFLLDHGFQVFLDAYPEGPGFLDYRALDFRPFDSGALIWDGEHFSRLSDPWRQPARAFQTLTAPVGTLGDKFRVASLRAEVTRGNDPQSLLERPDRTTLEELRVRGFSEEMVERFFRPFYGGVFLDPSLETSSRLFLYTFRMFSQGRAVVPARGMAEIPRQMAAQLPPGAIRTGVRVVEAGAGRVTLEGGEVLEGRAVIVALDGTAQARLMGEPPQPTRRVTCLYFRAPRDPVGEPLVVLDGAGEGPVNNLAVMSAVSREYAPPGQALISASVLGPDAPDLEARVRTQMGRWFGPETVSEWDLLATYPVELALPAQPPGRLQPPSRTAVRPSGLIVAGDHTETASTQGALRSGRIAGELALEALA